MYMWQVIIETEIYIIFLKFVFLCQGDLWYMFCLSTKFQAERLTLYEVTALLT